jgi:hypothetical protein
LSRIGSLEELIHSGFHEACTDLATSSRIRISHCIIGANRRNEEPLFGDSNIIIVIAFDATNYVDSPSVTSIPF